MACLVLFLAVLCGGCSALAQKHANGVGTAFDATREYPRLFECVEGMGNVGLILLPYFLIYAAIDFPLTFLAETLLLPVDLALRNPRPKKEQAAPCK
jgi:uncharacterized protein YceK